MPWAGYKHLMERFALPCIAPAVPAEVQSVTRIVREDHRLLVSPGVAPPQDAPVVEHLLFALRHEGVDIAAIDALAHAGALTDAQVRDAFAKAPNSVFARRLCFLWEHVTGRELQDVPAPSAAYAPLYDPDLYYTAPAITRSTKWRVDFNGLGVPGYSPTVRKTTRMHELLQRDVFAEVREFAEGASQSGLLDRILSWAYLAETRSSFEIEHETPSADKAEAFVLALQEAHRARPLDEAYLVSLQNTIITNPLGREVAYRGEQNWLARGGKGVLAVKYVPPAPTALDTLMPDFCAMASDPRGAPALVHAALSAFGFVYLHPFMDGNGRLSRFLFHHSLCASKSLPDGLILPTSAAMKADERGYLSALETFSRPARELWGIRWVDTGYLFEQRCRDSVYRYWDATSQAEFSARMAAAAVDVHLVGEAQFLANFDRAYKELDTRLDLPAPLLHRMILMCQEHGGVMSKNRRKQLQHQVPPEYFDVIEAVVKDSFEFP